MQHHHVNVDVQALGPVVARRSRESGPDVVLTRPRPLAALVYLMLAHPRGLHSRDTLIAILWPEADNSHGRHALRNVLHTIRSTLGEGVLSSVGDSLIGVDGSQVRCDALRFEDALAGGRPEDAMSLYHGELLQGFHVSGAPAFESWLEVERRRMRNAMLEAARLTVDGLRARGDARGALAVARRASALAPDDEPTLRRLLSLLIEDGDHVGALQTYERFATELRREYEAEPGRETQALLVDARRVRPAGGVRAQDHSPQPRMARPARDAETYVLYVRGHYLFLRAIHSGDVDDLRQSRALFEQALTLDPEFALAFAGLSNFFVLAAVRNLIRPFDETFLHALELGRRALALDPTLAIQHVHFGTKAMYLDADWEVAGREFERAIALDPSYAEAYRFYGVYLCAMGRRAEAIAALREAVRLEPHIATFRNALGAAYLEEGSYAAAIAEFHGALELDPKYAAARDRLIRCHERLGDFAEAIVERRIRDASEALVFAKAFEEGGAAGYRRARGEELARTVALLESRASVEPPDNAADIINPLPLRIALAYAELRDWESARAWEHALCSTNPGKRIWFMNHPGLAPLYRAG